jgi:hypothetical protein
MPAKGARVAFSLSVGLGIGWATSGHLGGIVALAVVVAALSGYNKAYSP